MDTIGSTTINDIYCFIFMTLIATALWVYYFRHRSFTFLAFAMFFPGFFAIFIHIYHGTLIHFVIFLVFPTSILTVYYSILAIILDVFVIFSCILINYCLGWGKIIQSMTIQKESVHGHNQQLLHGWFRAMGEEVGWRSYLVPGLLNHFHPILALNISGIVWGLYHVPIMILLCFNSNRRQINRKRTVFIQFTSCWVSGIAYGWIAMQSNYSCIPVTIAHFFWNQLNPRVLGSIYTNTPGWMIGEQWKINGEGLIGIIVYIIIDMLIMVHLYFL